MSRVRVALVLVALALFAPLALLVTRALESEAAERAAREGAVADRAFDEMERALSDFLAREDARPAGHYRYFMTPEGAEPGVLVRSPLASPSADPFVLGYFQVDSDGSVHSPLRPRPDEAARAAAETAPTAAALETARRVEALVGAALASSGAKERDAASARNVAPAPPAAEPAPIATKDEKAKAGGVYDALQQLNRGAEVRAQRSRKLAAPEEEAVAVAPPPAPEASRAPASDWASSGALAKPSAVAEPQRAAAPKLAPPQAAVAGRVEAEAAAPSAAFAESVERKLDAEFPPEESAAREAKKAEEPPSDAGARSEGLAGAVAKRSDVAPGAASPPPSAAPRPAAAPARPTPTPLRVAVDPLIGRSLDPSHLLLQRTVLIGERGLRQGLVLDVPKLGAWLREQSVGDGRLPGAEATFAARFDDAGATRDGQGRSLHAHRFAEPFDGLAVQLALPPLESGRRFGTIAALAALVVLATCIGLVAVERMVSLAVGFAERRSNFVAAVSHELKTPLTTIRMYGEMLRDGMVPSDAKRSEYYRTITAEAERLSRLIGNVLEFARLEKGTREMALTVGPLGPVVQELAGFLRAHVEAEGFSLEVETQPDLPPVRFERDALLQVLFNLVDNAVKYARGAKERRVVVACRSAADGGVELAVRDFGPGVPAGHLRRVFEPFHRAESELTRTTQGTGLGLALVRGLAERMGARVAGANVPGGGFEVRLGFAGAARGGAGAGAG